MSVSTIPSRHSLAPLATGLLAAALFGAATPASKALLGSLTPFQLAGLLYLGAAVGVLPFTLRTRSLSLPARSSRITLLRLLGAIALGGILGPVLLLFGLQAASSASVALWLNLELVATAVLGLLLFHDPLTRRSAVAAGGTLLAAVLIAAAERSAGLRAGTLVLLACICWGIDNHLTALIDGLLPTQTTFWKGMVAGSVNLAIGVALAPIVASLEIILMALALGALAYGMSIVLYIVSAQQMGATRSQVVFSSSPFWGVLLSALCLGESLSALQVAAMLLIAGALAFLVVENHAHLHEHAPVTHVHGHHHADGHHGHSHPSGAQPAWHTHVHEHPRHLHAHTHWPDLHHRHSHDGSHAAGDSR